VEETGHEAGDFGRLRRLDARAVPLDAGDARLPSGDTEPGDECRDDERRGEHRQAVPAHEAAGAVSPGAAARPDRAPG